jgi:hypothetical protein
LIFAAPGRAETFLVDIAITFALGMAVQSRVREGKYPVKVII